MQTYDSEVVAGAVGGVVTPALTAAGIGGFYGGAISGATSGIASNLTAGIINGDDYKTIVKKSLSGALIGATIGGVVEGIGALSKGKEFMDGTKIDYKPLVEDSNMPHVIQIGKNDCTTATGEMSIKSQGGFFGQKDIRGWMGGGNEPLDDTKVIEMIRVRAKLNADGIGPGYMQSDIYVSKTDYVMNSIGSGRSVNMTLPGTSIGHSVSVKGSYLKQITKVNGKLHTSLVHKIFDPARIQPYYVSTNWMNKNVVNIFSLWK
jgi:hypothetical protein